MRSNAEKSEAWFVWTEVGLTLWIYFLLVTLFIAVPPFVVPAFGFHLNLRQGTSVTLAGVLLAEVVAFTALVLWLRRRSLSLRSLGFRRPTQWLPVIVAVALALCYAGFTLMIPEVRSHAAEISTFKIWGVFVGVIGALVEETIFRGFILTELQRLRTAAWMQVVVSGVTFGLLHFGFSWWGMVCTTVMGMFLAITYLWSGRSLLAPVASHCLINIIIEPWLLLYVITYYATMFST